MDILQYINRMNRLYGNDPTPVRYNTQKYLQGGRGGMKPGGLVEPGVTHYGKKDYSGQSARIKETKEFYNNGELKLYFRI